MSSNLPIIFSVIAAFIFKACESYIVCRCLTPKHGYILTFFILTLTAFPIRTLILMRNFMATGYSILMFVVFGVLVCILFRDRIYRKLFVIFAFILTNSLVGIVYYSLAMLRGIPDRNVYDYYGITAIIVVTLTIELTFMRVWRKKSGRITADGRDFALFMVLPFSQIVICMLLQMFYTSSFFMSESTWINLSADGRRFLSLSLVIFCILLFMVSDIFIYQLMMRVTSNTRLRTQIEYMEARDKEILEYYEIMEKNNAETRKIRHDLANTLEIARCLAESDSDDAKKSAEKVLNSMEEELDKIKVKRYTESSLVNVILTNKAAECYDRGIEPDFHAMLPRAIPTIEKLDSTRLLVNLLDNAIFATEHSDGEKKITANIKYIDEILTISVRNPIAENAVKNDGKEHGYGLKIIGDVAKKYGGTVTVTKENGYYETVITGHIKQFPTDK